MVFAANDKFDCHLTDVGLDGVTLLAQHPRKGGEFVRIQCCLEPGHWLDADTVLEECRLEDGNWIWSLSFVGLSETQHAELDDILQRRRIAQAHRPSSIPTRPAPPPPPPSDDRPSQLRLRADAELEVPTSAKSLKELYADALHEVADNEEHHGKVIVTSDAMWQARNWARKLG